MLTLDAQGRPCYSSGGGARVHPQRVVKEVVKTSLTQSVSFPNTKAVTSSNLGNNGTSVPSTPFDSPRGGVYASSSSGSTKSVLVPISANSLTNNTANSNSNNITSHSALTFVPPIKLQKQSESSMSSSKLPAGDDSDINRSKDNSRDNIVLIEKLKSKVKELEKDNEKLKAHVVQAEECIKNYRMQNNNNGAHMQIRFPSREASCQTDRDSLDNSSLASARNSFATNNLDSNAITVIRQQSENAKLLAIMEEYKSENRSLNLKLENKDQQVAQLSRLVEELESDKAKRGNKVAVSVTNVGLDHSDHGNSIDLVSDCDDGCSSNNKKETSSLNGASLTGDFSECLGTLSLYKSELLGLKTEFQNLLLVEQKECFDGMQMILTKINQMQRNGSKNNSNINDSIKAIKSNNVSFEKRNDDQSSTVISLEKKIAELEQKLQHHMHDKEISDRTMAMITLEMKQLRFQEEKYVRDIDSLQASLAEKDVFIHGLRVEADTRLDHEISKWKSAKARKTESGNDPMTPLKVHPPPVLDISTTDKLLLDEKEATKILNTKIQELKSKLTLSIEDLAKLQEVHKREMDAQKHCAHVKDLARIALHREVALERDKMCSDLKHSREVYNILTCSLNTAEQSLSETQKDVVLKLIEGRMKRIKLIEKQTQERAKDIDQRSMETCVVSSQHLEVFQKKANEKLRVASEEADRLFSSLKEALSHSNV